MKYAGEVGGRVPADLAAINHPPPAAAGAQTARTGIPALARWSLTSATVCRP